MSGVRLEATMPAPRADVWRALVDFERWPTWFLGVRSLRATPPEGGLGAERRLRLVHGPSHRERITRWEPPEGFALDVLDPPVFARRFGASVGLVEVAEGTRVQWEMDWVIRFGLLGRVFERLLLAPVLRVALRVSLARLAKRLRSPDRS